MLTTKKPSQFSPLALAYIGDGVYELFVRTRIIEEHENLPANKLHIKDRSVCQSTRTVKQYRRNA